MTNPKIGADVWAGLGVTPWTMRTDFAFDQTAVVEKPTVIEPLPVVQKDVQETKQKIEPEIESDKLDTMNTTPRWVIIGSGLNAIWQQDNNQAWLLWQAIAQFHFESVDAVTFYDTDLIESEQALFDVVEQIIELDVEWVYSMDSEHVLHHQLVEGVNVVTLPSFDDMLAQPQLKRDAYQRLLQPELFCVVEEF